jgi:hypothetical protein
LSLSIDHPNQTDTIADRAFIHLFKRSAPGGSPCLCGPEPLLWKTLQQDLGSIAYNR